LVEIEARLEAIADQPQAEGLDVHLLVGGIGDLATLCKVWFTDRFDIEAEIARLSAEAAS
jgi:hypothetical protein